MGCASSSPVPPAAAHNDKLSKEADGSGGSSVSSEHVAGKHVVNTQKGLRDSALMEQTRSMEGTKGEDAGARSRATIKTPAGAEDGASIPENGEALLQGGKGPARASGEPPRKSRDSVASSPAVRGSTRSSFAADAVLLNTAGRQGQGDGLGPMAGRNKATAERLAGQPDASGLSGQYVPAALERPFSRLVVVPPDTPVPTSMLQNLWQLASLSQVTAVVTALQTQGVLRVATLDDMSVWCLVSGATLEHLQHKYVAQTSYFHALLLDSYSRNCTSGSGRQSGSGALQVRDIPDDGYIMQNIAHHLLGCGRLNTLRSLLGEPAWLEAKLHAYGTAPVVADFRRYLAEEPEDTGVRLLLQAFQLSLGCCAEQPGVHMLREQMLSRLITAAHMQPGAPVLRSPSGGAALTARRTDSARAERESQSGVAELDAAGKAVSLSTEQAILTTRDSARYSDASNSLREWFEGQSSHAAMDIITSAGRSCVHLLPRSASLKQAGGLQRMILRGHAGPIHKVVISPNGQDVVTVSADGSAQVWDMNVGDCVMQLARQQALSDVDVAPDGCLCVVASVDGAACVWDLATGKVKHVLKGHTAKINSVAIDKAGKRCVTASDDRSVRLWDIEKGTCQAVLAGHGHSHAATGRSGASGEFGLVFDVALSSDGSFAATASEDFTARVWDLVEAKCEHVLEGHTGWVVAVQFLGDTTHVITASHDNTARVWDGIRGCCLHILTGHTGRLSSVCVDAAGQLAVTSSDDGTARIWEIETGKCRHVLERHVAWVADAAITRDGSRCVTVGGDALVCVWNCSTGELQATLEGHSAALRSVVLSGGGRFAVTAGEDCTACVWDLGVKGTCAHPQQHGHRAKIMAVRTLAGRRQVVTSCEDGEVLLWDVSDCKPMRALQGHMVAAAKHLGVSAGGSRVLAGTANRHVCCWDAATGALLSSLPAQQGSRVKEMAFSRSGTYVATVLFDSQTAVYDITTGKVVAQLIGRGERVGRNVHTGGVNGILLCGANGGTETAITWSKDCTARIWDIATNTMRSVCEGHTDGIRCAAISTDEVLLATASYAPCVRLHMVEDGSPVAVLDHATAAVQVAFSPDGNLLAVALENHTVVIWDLVAHSCLNPIVAHKNDIMDLVFSPDSLLLVTCSQDCSVRVWDARTGGPIAFFVADSALMACSFAGGEPGGVADILVAADAGGATHFLDLPQELQPGGTGLVLR